VIIAKNNFKVNKVYFFLEEDLKILDLPINRNPLAQPEAQNLT
jgi:hypothetical protein